MRSHALIHPLIALLFSIFLSLALCATVPIHAPNHRRSAYESERTRNWLSLYEDHLGNDNGDSNPRRPSHHTTVHDNDNDDLWSVESQGRQQKHVLDSDSGSTTAYTSPYVTTFASRPPSYSFTPLAEISELLGMRLPMGKLLGHLVWERVPGWWESMRVRVMRPIGGDSNIETSTDVVHEREDDVFLMRAMEEPTFMRMDDLPPELVVRRG